MAGNKKYNYTPEQAKQVKNFMVSVNILKQDIRKMQELLPTLPEEQKPAVIEKINYKLSRIEEKTALANEIKAACLIPVVELPSVGQPKEKKIKKSDAKATIDAPTDF